MSVASPATAAAPAATAAEAAPPGSHEWRESLYGWTRFASDRYIGDHFGALLDISLEKLGGLPV
jgi:hypothetical protein